MTGAHPNSPCNRIDGVVMPTPHGKRKELALGVSVSKHERIFTSLALLKANLANRSFRRTHPRLRDRRTDTRQS